MSVFYTEAESFKVSLKAKEEEIDRYELKLREEREKNTKIMAQLPILEKCEIENNIHVQMGYRTVIK